MIRKHHQGSLKNQVVLALPLILIVVLFLVNIPIDTELVSNTSLLSSQWVSGYCVAPGGSTFSCPVSVSEINNSLLQISGTSNISTVLFQLVPSYANWFSNSYVIYAITVDSKTAENVTFKFSQVANSNYYSSQIASVSTSTGLGPRSVTGSLNVVSIRRALASVLSMPARVEVNLEPSASQLFIGVSLVSEASASIGGVLTSSGPRVSALIAGIGAYYGILPRAKSVRILGTGVMSGATVIAGSLVASQVFSLWPPFDPAFTWLFSLGVFSGIGILVLYFATERSRI